MITIVPVDSTDWTALTTAGQSGVICLTTATEDDSSVRIYHSTSVPVLGEAGEGEVQVPALSGARLMPRDFNDDFLTISADTSEDIFYAVCSNAGDTAMVFVDVI